MNKSPAPVQSEASESCGNRIDSSILHFFLLAALCGTLYFPYLGSTPFFDKGEPREALAVQDIVRRGEWLVPLKRATDIPSKPQQLLYFVVWFGAVFIFFSAFTQKRPVYILPLYPAVALLLGAWWQKLKDNRSESSHIFTRTAAYMNAVSFLLLSGVLLFQILGPGLLTYIRPVLYPRDQAEFLILSNLLLEHQPAMFFWATACGLGGVFLFVAVRKEAWGPFVGCMAALMVISLFFVQKFDVSLANHYLILTKHPKAIPSSRRYAPARTLRVRSLRQTLSQHALLDQQRAKLLYPLAIDAKITITQTRRRPHRDQIFAWPQVKLEIVDKAKHCAAAFYVEIIVRRTDDLRSRQLADGSSQRAPRLARRNYNMKRHNAVSVIGRITRHAIRRCRAHRQTAVFDP